jgi:hypothetical protein
MGRPRGRRLYDGSQLKGRYEVSSCRQAPAFQVGQELGLGSAILAGSRANENAMIGTFQRDQSRKTERFHPVHGDLNAAVRFKWNGLLSAHGWIVP